MVYFAFSKFFLFSFLHSLQLVEKMICFSHSRLSPRTRSSPRPRTQMLRTQQFEGSKKEKEKMENGSRLRLAEPARVNGITESSRHGSRRRGRCCRARRCRAPTRGRRRSCRSSRRRATNGTNQSWVLWGLSRFLMNKAHTNPGTTPKHCQACHRDPRRLEVCRQLVECRK